MKEKYKLAYMDIAKRFSECSTAKRLKVGAICVKDNKIISIGINGTPNGWPNEICEDENNVTYPYIIHAEGNMLAKLCRSTENSEGSDVYITHSPCLECSKLLYQSGIKKVYYSEEYRKREGIEFLKKVGIEVEKIEVEKKE